MKRREGGTIDQISLVREFAEAVGRQGWKVVNARQFNALISSVNLVKAEFDKPHVPAVPDMGMDAWLACDDVGESSKYMVGVLRPWVEAGLCNPVRWPLDGDYFRRCSLFLKGVPPNKRMPLEDMGACCPQWAALVACWNELESLLAEGEASGSLSKLDDRLRLILTGRVEHEGRARVADV